MLFLAMVGVSLYIFLEVIIIHRTIPEHLRGIPDLFHRYLNIRAQLNVACISLFQLKRKTIIEACHIGTLLIRFLIGASRLLVSLEFFSKKFSVQKLLGIFQKSTYRNRICILLRGRKVIHIDITLPRNIGLSFTISSCKMLVSSSGRA